MTWDNRAEMQQLQKNMHTWSFDSDCYFEFGKRFINKWVCPSSFFVKICMFGVLESLGLSKSFFWLINDSFWWGARLRGLDSECAQLRVFYPSSFERVDYCFGLGKRFISNWVCPNYLIL